MAATPPQSGVNPVHAGVTSGDILAYAEQQIGKPYVYAAEGPNSFDCSGLTSYVFKHFGIAIPRTSEEQATFGIPVSLSQIQPGDLITSDWGDGYAGHVAFYAGDGKTLEASHPGTSVRYVPFDASYKAHVSDVRRMPGYSLGGSNGATGLSGISGTGDQDSLLSGLGGLVPGVSQIASFFGALMWLTNPANWARIILFLLGLGSIGAGVYFIVKEVQTA